MTKQKQPNMTSDLNNIMRSISSFIKNAENGEGLGLTDEQKEEFKKRLKESDASNALNELKNKINNLKVAAGK